MKQRLEIVVSDNYIINSLADNDLSRMIVEFFITLCGVIERMLRWMWRDE